MNNKLYIEDLISALTDELYDSDYITACINYATNLLTHNLPVVFDIEHLSCLLGMQYDSLRAYIFSDAAKVYTVKKVPKKNGDFRTLNIPCFTLKYIQRWILENILYRMRVSQYSMGFVQKKSILTNAQSHIDAEVMLNVDIKDFFPSITIYRIYQIFRYHGYTKEVSFALSKLCTYKGTLPQGSPASPYLSNLVCLKLDKRIGLLAATCGACYTRYADDITLSGANAVRHLVSVVIDIIHDEGFEHNAKKTRVSCSGQRMEVTGLILSQGKVRVSKKFKRKLNQEIYYCLKYGVSSHQDHIGDHRRYFKEYIYGKAYFVYMVEPEIGKGLIDKLGEINWEG